MRRRGVSSECRRSSCSSLYRIFWYPNCKISSSECRRSSCSSLYRISWYPNCKISMSLILDLIQCFLVEPYGMTDLDQYWIREWLIVWQHQAITWFSVGRWVEYHISNIWLCNWFPKNVICSDLNLFFFKCNVIFHSYSLKICYVSMKIIKCSEYVVSAVDTDGLVLQHQGICSHSAEYAPMCFQLFMGWSLLS